MNNTLLKIDNMKTCFRAGKKQFNTILDGVSITLKRGEIIGLVGESGSGKSMTMLSTLQLLPGTGFVAGGTVTLGDDGTDLLSYPPESPAMREVRGGRIGMIFQEPMTSLNPVLTIGDQISESIMLHLKLSKAEAKKRAIEMLDMVNIPDAAVRYNEYPMQFSGGMRQRIMIAMVLSAQPDILIADEATTALDVTMQAQILEMIRDLAEKTGIAVIMVTHNLGIVARYAERIYVMYAGNVVEEGMANHIFHSPKHPYTMGLLRAIPRLNDSKDRVLVPIEGMPPSPASRPSYCPFYPRCKYRKDSCMEDAKPLLREIEPSHFVACHLAGDEIDSQKYRVQQESQTSRPPKVILDEVCLEVSDLCKSFEVRKGFMKVKIGEFNAVEDVSFTLRRGETLGIVGESGCGKTTLARTLLRMYKPSAGKISVMGTDIAQLNNRELVPHRKCMAMVFQDPFSSLNPRMSAGTLVAEPIKIHKIIRSSLEIENRVNELFEMVGLDVSMKGRLPHEFSGGQRQRIGIARALASDPDILVLDEPISALDVSIQAQVINLLEKLQSKLGLAYIFIAHDLAVVKHISDRVLVMYLGRVMEVAPSDELYERPLHPYTKVLLSAVPIPDPEIEKQRDYVALQGEVPSVMNRPKGCPFSNRCQYVMERCKVEVPPMRDMGNGHGMACFL